MQKIKIAQIGIGHDHAGDVFEELQHASDLFEVVGYAEVPEDDFPDAWTQARLKSARAIYRNAKKYTVEEILAMPDLDAVAVETYDLHLVKYAQMAADRGLHVHMDKAPGESAEAFEKLLATVKRKKLAFGLGYMYRYNPFIRQAIESAQSDALGKIHSVDAEMSCLYDKDKRDWLGYFQGGMMQYLGCHLVDLVVRLLGVPDEIVPMNCSTGYRGTTAKDFALACFKYKNGVSTVKSVMGEYGGFVRRHLLISGEKGTIDVRPLEMPEPDGLHTMSARKTLYDSPDWTNFGTVTHSDAFGRYESMIRTFAAIVRGERGYEVPLETEARIHRCLLAASGISCHYKKRISFE